MLDKSDSTYKKEKIKAKNKGERATKKVMVSKKSTVAVENLKLRKGLIKEELFSRVVIVLLRIYSSKEIEILQRSYLERSRMNVRGRLEDESERLSFKCMFL